MDSFADALIALVGRDAALWVGTFVLSSPMWGYALMQLRKGLQRHRAFREFAAARQLQFLGTIPSDARVPYRRVEVVRQKVLLRNAIEGQWDRLPIYLFDVPADSRSILGGTTILVTVEGTLHRGAAAASAIATHPDALIVTELDILCVSPKRQLDASELATWLSFATTLAKAMEREAKEQARFDTSPPAPRPARTMFGTSVSD
jgi:hypothetical protein